MESGRTGAAARAEAYFHLAEASFARKDFKGAKAYATVVATLFENTEWFAKAEAMLKSLPEEGGS